MSNMDKSAAYRAYLQQHTHPDCFCAFDTEYEALGAALGKVDRSLPKPKTKMELVEEMTKYIGAGDAK